MTGAEAVDPRRVFFEIAMFQTLPGQWDKNTRDYHNPTRQRGIYGDTGKTLQLGPQLTFRVWMSTNAQLQDAGSGAIEKPALLRSEVLLFRYAAIELWFCCNQTPAACRRSG